MAVGDLDFRVIWIAGKSWASGQNPYGPTFTPDYFNAFGPGPGALWFYPPYWYPIALPFSFLPFPIANSLWKIANAALLIGAIHLIARALADVTGQKYRTIFLCGIAYASFMQATSVNLFLGQTSILIFFGFAALIYGILEASSFSLIVGLVFLALKPQIGVVAFAGIAALRHYRWAIFPAGGICLLATTPIALSGNYRVSIEGFLANLPRQPSVPGNEFPNLTGLANISGYIFPKSVEFYISMALVIAAVACAIAIFKNLRIDKRLEAAGVQHQIACLMLFVVSIFLFVPLHSYDIVPLSALLMMTVAAPLPGSWFIILGLLLCLRPRNLWDALGIETSEKLTFPESPLVSAGLLLIFIGAFWAFLHNSIARPATY